MIIYLDQKHKDKETHLCKQISTSSISKYVVLQTLGLWSPLLGLRPKNLALYVCAVCDP